ncbi:hypothetical protein [Dictyobacter aurantiacus]|uniref:Uncharacterized protein n=1 Tax=Dictyobacter aurantiacus TaxID=1936993 RepID=A0A401ZSV3_9CHLR|nr:hypothetical protein [Dictyobacter aurantiacus]GCE09969.1 hypothetical protein KDAU_72980 [Dictyobacter aurantiacus]
MAKEENKKQEQDVRHNLFVSPDEEVHSVIDIEHGEEVHSPIDAEGQGGQTHHPNVRAEKNLAKSQSGVKKQENPPAVNRKTNAYNEYH